MPPVRIRTARSGTNTSSRVGALPALVDVDLDGQHDPEGVRGPLDGGVHLGVPDGVHPVRLPQEQLLQLGRAVVVGRSERNATGFSRSRSVATSRWYASGPQTVTRAPFVALAAPARRR